VSISASTRGAQARRTRPGEGRGAHKARGDPRRAVPAGGDATDADIDDEEIWVSGPRGGARGPEARCCQGGVRICKDVAEDTEVVEEGLKREEIDVDDESEGRAR
jgi:hypothetical protein